MGDGYHSDIGPKLLDTSLQGEGYRDVPGIVWQAAHVPPDGADGGDVSETSAD